MDDLNHTPPSLSPDGLRRRAAMREALIDRMQTRSRRLPTSQLALAVVLCVTTFAAAFLPAGRGALTDAISPSGRVAAGDAHTSDVPAEMLLADAAEQTTALRTQFIRTATLGSSVTVVATTERPLIARIDTHQPNAIELDDAQLLSLLSEIGRPTGLIRFAGRTMLTDPVTDVELSPPPDSGVHRRSPLPDSVDLPGNMSRTVRLALASLPMLWNRAGG